MAQVVGWLHDAKNDVIAAVNDVADLPNTLINDIKAATRPTHSALPTPRAPCPPGALLTLCAPCVFRQDAVKEMAGLTEDGGCKILDAAADEVNNRATPHTLHSHTVLSPS